MNTGASFATPGARVAAVKARDRATRRPRHNLDDPKVRVKRNFPFKPPLRLVGVNRRPPVCARKTILSTPGGRVRSEGLRRRAIERGATVQVIDLDKNSAGLRSAAAAEGPRLPLHSASPQIGGGDPNVGAQAQRDFSGLRLAPRASAA